jgi:hypothetical protein
MSDLTSADFDRLDQLTAMLAAIPKVTAAGRKLLSAEQHRDAMVRHAEKAKAEAASAISAAEKLRADMELAKSSMELASQTAKAECEAMLADANSRAKSLITNAQDAASEILLRAHDEADEAKREASTIRATIAAERSEVAKLEAKAAKIREQLKKMIGE